MCAQEAAFEKAKISAADIRRRCGNITIDLTLVLGSGWVAVTQDQRLGHIIAEIPAGDIQGAPETGNIAGHKGTLTVIKTNKNQHVLLVGARIHLYEGQGPDAVAHWIRTAAELGSSDLILTNGCGGLDPHIKPGTPVLISDHINLTGTSPLSGPTFVDLSDVYSKELRELARTVVPTLTEGVYAQFPGPHYETPAEVKMAAILGAQLVGMSTALEAIAAAHVGMRTLGLSLVTNLAAGVSSEPLSHEEVMAAGMAAAPKLVELLNTLVNTILEEEPA